MLNKLIAALNYTSNSLLSACWCRLHRNNLCSNISAARKCRCGRAIVEQI